MVLQIVILKAVCVVFLESVRIVFLQIVILKAVILEAVLALYLNA
ncbi:hypothetical protein [Helicobacter sp. T3_23-1059]